MSSTLRWGILGTGNIAKQFAAGMTSSRRGKITAVGSRTPESARAFAQTHRIPSQHDYENLLLNPAVDAIYLSLPNSLHHEWTIKALRAGKHVLCEKPFALNAAQSTEMFDIAQKTGRVLVEAFMYRSHPYVAAVDAAIQSGIIGQPRLIRTSFCYRTTKIAGNVRFAPQLAGGALMDVGCYCINFSRHFAGAEPSKIHAAAKFHTTGVDEITSATLEFPNSLLATFTCGMSLQADNTAAICGTDGYIEIAWPWKPTPGKGGYILARSTPPRQDQKNASAPPTPPRQEFKIDIDQDLYALEADDFAATVLDSKPPSITRDDTLGNMRVIDEICTQIGLHF
ncbi:MAG TPA: Gfo/Idh/MocA family oxidoreductase [Tepidisphaeraceae bacterium]|jgi:predicted dehydrogenase|nr:Gfo/Idh/MocA family oxidoreductase [Tepidisphaeraceae bacterium]